MSATVARTRARSVCAFVISVVIAVTCLPLPLRAATAQTAPPAFDATVITDPAAASNRPAGTVSISGTADLTATRVRIAVQDKATNLWYQHDGTWKERQRSRTTRARDGGWSWSFIDVAAGTYTLHAWALDADKQPLDAPGAQTTFSVTGTLVADRPVVNVDAPAAADVFAAGSGFQASGLATDDEGIKRVRVRIGSVASKEFLQTDGSFAKKRQWHTATLDADQATTTGWTFDVAGGLPAGLYTMRVQGYDLANMVSY